MKYVSTMPIYEYYPLKKPYIIVPKSSLKFGEKPADKLSEAPTRNFYFGLTLDW